ncbi:hypothetical protein AYX14_07081 [Cryptococcus neoformans]|nr:hypothetical protein AYX14_07081 [Cryptococcus neoformans var. grubii]
MSIFYLADKVRLWLLRNNPNPDPVEQMNKF